MSEQMSRLTIPNNIKVGFQKRSDTYSGKLAYVVFRDTKGVLRKSGSWERWRDKKIPAEDYDNNPISGFVLNRDVGGVRHSYGEWNPRIEKVRVYDPRGFEFEIGIPNLLFILQECSSIKGKGLEGDFVYSWMGKDLILLPVGCKEYQESQEHNVLIQKKVNKEEVKEGCLYRNKDHEVLMYLGRHTWWGDLRDWGKQLHIFLDTEASAGGKPVYEYHKDFNKLAEVVSDVPSPDFADAYEALIKAGEVGKAVDIELIPLSPEELADPSYKTVVLESQGVITVGTVQTNYSGWRGWDGTYSFRPVSQVSFKNGKYISKPVTREYKGLEKIGSLNKSDLNMVKRLWVKTEDGKRHKLGGRYE